MKITFLLTQSLESPSGLGRYWPLSKELARLGHQVTILALHHDFKALSRRQFVQDGVKVHYVAQMHVLKSGSGKFYFNPAKLLWTSALATWRLMRACQKTPADIYHLGKPHPMNGLAVLLPHLMKKKPVYIDCDDYEAASNRFGKKWQKRVVAFFEDRLPIIATGITTNTRFTLERLKNLGYPVERIVYVPNGVDRERFANIDRRAVTTLRRDLGLVGRPVVLYLGSLSLASHPVDLLVLAFVEILSSLPQAMLVLVGGGEDYDFLRQKVKELGIEANVLFTGRVRPEDVPLYLAMAKVTVDPVYDDPVGRARSPLKVIESLAAGTPVVAGDVGERSVSLGRGGGLLVPPGDPIALAEGLVAILTDNEPSARLTKEVQEMCEQYHWDKLVHDFVQVYV